MTSSSDADETMTFKAILFDLDGTLLDTLEDIADSANRVLAGRGLPTHPVDAYREAVGQGARQLIVNILPDADRDTDTIRTCLDDFLGGYGQNWNKKTKPYAGVRELLDALKTRGIKLAVLSNKPAEFTVKCVNELLPGWTFDAIIGASDDMPNKPDPAGAVEVARRLNIAPEEILFVGDSGIDMRTAVAAGMFAVGALWGFRGRDELLREGAKVLVNHPREILKLIQ
jgi:phosphoglycolate phosphatase